jgi:LysM repeat protein
VSADALLTLNGITNADLIAVGQDLKIPGEAPPEYGGARPYTVRVGDTLSRIARDFGVSQDELAKLNNITNPDQLKVGQQLRIPTTGASPAAGPARTHTVRAGETLSTIAQQYGVTPWALQTANNITNANQIYAGQVLKIP